MTYEGLKVDEIIWIAWNEAAAAWCRVLREGTDSMLVIALDNNKQYHISAGSEYHCVRKATPKELELMPLIELGYVEL